jgi:hypothetical protein
VKDSLSSRSPVQLVNTQPIKVDLFFNRRSHSNRV